MLRGLIFAVVFVTVMVMLRLIVLSLTAKPQRKAAPAAPTIDAKPRFTAAMTVRKFDFKRFDARTGPADPENFREALTLHAAPEGTDDIGIYSLVVATPKALAQALSAAPYSFQRNVIVVPRYDLAIIERAVHEHINEIVYLSGEDA